MEPKDPCSQMFFKSINYMYRTVRRPMGRFFLFAVLCFVWLVYIISVQLDFENKQDDVKEKITQLSHKYARIIKNEEMREARFADHGHLEGSKQTTLILLQNILERLKVFEKQLGGMTPQSDQERVQLLQQINNLRFAIDTKFNDLLLAVNPNDCQVPNDPLYPECATKVEWLRKFWKRDAKFSANGVDGSVCSFLAYFSENENYCPDPKNKSNKDCGLLNNTYLTPECKSRISWMLQHWKSDPKYASHGVDGSLCSILKYLTKVEKWCALLSYPISASYKNDCVVPHDTGYPYCENKVDWMRSHWILHPCFAMDYNVDGSVCSFLRYLSEVENWCPKSSKSLHDTAKNKKVDIKGTNKDDLIDKLSRMISSSRLYWIRQRIGRLYNDWVSAFDNLQTTVTVTENEQKKILLHVGVLAQEHSLGFAENADKGGPLGEMVQWSDLITSLYILGHNIHVTVENKDFLRTIATKRRRNCPAVGELKFDLVYTDYFGLNFLKKKGMSTLESYSCRLRIIDSFGTEAQFNYDGPQPRYAVPPGFTMVKKSVLGANNLNLKQYMTMFLPGLLDTVRSAHSPDNSFLGFVVDSKMNIPNSPNKKPQAVAYGKHYHMWKGLKSRAFLDVIHEYFEIHATVGGMTLSGVQSFLPDYVINHGVLEPDQLQKLLRESKLFIGLGFPYEGPAPLEAIAQGCVFLNPKFKPPKNQINTKFFKGKPTFRSLTCQHPYAEIFIGEPYVYTVDIDDIGALKVAVKKIVNDQPPPYLPFEFTNEGMLERVNAFVNNQDFCNRRITWPPLTSRKVFASKKGQSCHNVCLEKGLMCEPAFFPSINNRDSLKKTTFPCDTINVAVRPSLVAPAYIDEDKECVLQGVPTLYSCTGSHSSVRRICPCRDYRNGQAVAYTAVLGHISPYGEYVLADTTGMVT